MSHVFYRSRRNAYGWDETQALEDLLTGPDPFMVPVEPCEHGFYDPHIVSIDRSRRLDGGPDRTTCVGSLSMIGGNDG